MEFEKFLPYSIAASSARVMMSTDGLNWSHPDAKWRIRFVIDNSKDGFGWKDVVKFVQAHVIPLCQHPIHSATGGLYLTDKEDLVRIFREFRGVRGKPGEILSVQSYEQYEAILSLSSDLASGLRGDPLESEVDGRYDPLTTRDIPSLTWSGKGDGQTCDLFGRTLTVRCEERHGREVWVLDVDSEAGCAFEPNLKRITSEVAVADAIFEYRRRKNDAV